MIFKDFGTKFKLVKNNLAEILLLWKNLYLFKI